MMHLVTMESTIVYNIMIDKAYAHWCRKSPDSTKRKNIMNDIIIVGSGNAGLITALILKKTLPNISIKLIHDSETSIVGVGEGSTKEFRSFMNLMGWKPEDIWNNCGATYKFGTVFYDWFKHLETKIWVHAISPNIFSNTKFHYFYERVAEGTTPHKAEKLEDTIRDGVAPFEYNLASGFGDFLEPNQFHFDTFELNQFLTKSCFELGIIIEDQKILDVELTDGEIGSLVTGLGRETAKLYIDCTGLGKTLISKFPEFKKSWKDLSNEFLVNRAITWQTETDWEKIIAYTKSHAIEHGWVWTIPTQTHTGQGYVFSDNHVSLDQAIKEVSEKFPTFDPNKIGKDIKFSAGYSEKMWIGNCVAVGLSGSFCEPLEATNIATAINQAMLLTEHLPGDDHSYTSKSYNKIMNQIMYNLFDFVRLHYYSGRDDTQFWVDNNNVPMNDRITFLKEICESGGTPSKAFIETQPFNLFQQRNYIFHLYALGWWGQKNALNILKLTNSLQTPGELCPNEDLLHTFGASMIGLKKLMDTKQKYNITMYDQGKQYRTAQQ